jgi:hypothetical protein
MTTIERFQELQVELVRAGFATDLSARADGAEQAKVAMFVELHRQTAEQLEQLEQLTSARGFSFTVQENSRAAVTLVPGRARH